MKAQFNRDKTHLIRCCGYGVPNIDRALNSYENGFTFISQESIQPFVKTVPQYKTNDMHLYNLPWPTELLLSFDNTPVKLKITLSYFIEPSPGEIGWKDKYCYQSFGLRFDLKRVAETPDEFRKRINKAAREENETFNNTSDRFNWLIGPNKRDIPLDVYLKTSQIVVITGVRRCGKSSLMFLIKESLGLKESEFCYCNFDDERISTYPTLLNDIYSLHLETYRTEPVFFFDEIQEVSGWEKFVNRMYEQGRKVYVTGSNARLLSSEISTSLTGRNKVLELMPFSFSEYLRMEGRAYEVERLSVKQRSLLLNDLNAYLETGGFPLVVKEKDLDIAHALFQDILYRDIVVRYRLTNVDEVRQIALYLASNIGKLFSYSSLQAISSLKSSSSVKNYLDYFEASYLFFYVRKFDYLVRKQIMNSRKVYAVDNSIPNRLGFRFTANRGRLLENAVFLELKRRGCEVYYFSGKNECDFLIKENLRVTEAMQVVYELNAENIQRKIDGLAEAMHTFDIPKGTLIVFDAHHYQTELPQAVSVISAGEWMPGVKL